MMPNKSLKMSGGGVQWAKISETLKLEYIQTNFFAGCIIVYFKAVEIAIHVR